MVLRRGFTVSPGEKILVVEDVVTTGGSTRETITALQANGVEIVGAASIIDRSSGQADVGVPRIALATLDVQSVSPEDCEACKRGEVAVKPGSRKDRRQEQGRRRKTFIICHFKFLICHWIPELIVLS